MLRAMIVVASMLCLASPVVAAPLGPTKPSDLADLRTSFAQCPLNFPSATSLLVDQINLPDGGTAPFVIPPKQVFVVTSVELTLQLVPAGKRWDLSLFRVNGGSIGGLIVDTLGTSTGGAASTHVVIPNGAVVKSGTPLCMSAINLDGGAQEQPFPFGTVHGFFAKDK